MVERSFRRVATFLCDRNLARLRSPQLRLKLLLSVDYPLDSVTHEAKVILHGSRHSALVHQRQLTTCIFSDSASCLSDSVTCSTHNEFLFNVASFRRPLSEYLIFYFSPPAIQDGCLSQHVKESRCPKPTNVPLHRRCRRNFNFLVQRKNKQIVIPNLIRINPLFAIR